MEAIQYLNVSATFVSIGQSSSQLRQRRLGELNCKSGGIARLWAWICSRGAASPALLLWTPREVNNAFLP